MQSVEDLRRIGRELRGGELGLRTHPVGIKFCPESCDLTGFRRPRNFGIHMTVCQVINAARYGWAMAFTLEDMFCIGGAYLFGLVPEYPEFLETPISRHTSSDDAKKHINSRYLENALPKGSVKAVLVAPLESINFIPDVIDVYGTPTQINTIAKSLIWHGIFPETELLGLISCSVVTRAYKTRKPQVKIPGSGEIAWGGRTEEDEVSITIPLEHIDKVLSGLENIKRLNPYPPPRFWWYEPIAPKGYTITYKDYEEWKKRKNPQA
ncbi:DUF169 domain-containing protein [Vulcanisaeta souniana]|uniref:DUF169 domain-containing protein n=1 Tax=Vulcanisaeta souniana TaxID=164452 RepID=UPI001FB55363|nr:DUF169 domain-containing protein [Vulcanisaeta souniana]